MRLASQYARYRRICRPHARGEDGLVRDAAVAVSRPDPFDRGWNVWQTGGTDGWIYTPRVHLPIRQHCPPKTALPSGRIQLTSRHKSDVVRQYIRPVETRQHALTNDIGL
jgi:hypothetical protein